MTATLIHGDCLELMKGLPDKSVDLFLCDLPYGCLSPNDMKFDRTGDAAIFPSKKGVTGCAWDIKIDLEAFWVQVERLMKDDHTPIIHFCSTKFGYDLIKSKQSWFRYDLVWNKMRGVSFLTANKMPMRSHEMMYVFSKKGARYNRVDIDDETKKARTKDRTKEKSAYGITLCEGNDTPAGKRCALSVIEADNNASKKGKHPTQKPAGLYRWLMERYSKEGDTVLDPTAGSFASVFVAKEMGRHGIGMEMNKDFYDKAVGRGV